jgi:hypothetical protein
MLRCCRFEKRWKLEIGNWKIGYDECDECDDCDAVMGWMLTLITWVFLPVSFF